MQAMFDAKGIDLSRYEAESSFHDATGAGRGYGCAGGVRIGDGCQIGHNVVFATLNHFLEPEKRKKTYSAPIVLGKNVWIGSNATILQGVTIGDNAVIGAGAVVTGDIPADTVAVGVPARVVKHI